MNPIPYCPQQRIDGCERTCGAAALMMVYGSLGGRPRMTDVWRSVARPGSHGMRVPTHLLAADAIANGRPAVCLQVGERPLDALRTLHAAGWRVILNHLLAEHDEGHFSVLTDVDDQTVTLNDPLLGPNHRLRHDELLALWTPPYPTDEVAGGVLVAIGPAKAKPTSEDVCPACAAPFLLPRELGLRWDGPWDRQWRVAFCPSCDAIACPPLPHAACSA